MASISKRVVLIPYPTLAHLWIISKSWVKHVREQLSSKLVLALALAQVTGLNMDLSIGLTFLVCIFYTCLGGIKAVIWTNVFQAVCMITSCLIVVILGEKSIEGGSETVFKLSFESKRIELFNFDPSILVRHTFWSQVVGGYFTWMTIYGINQTMIQRLVYKSTNVK